MQLEGEKKIILQISHYIGINIGSVSVNVVSSDGFGTIRGIKKPHFGNPQHLLKQILQEEGLDKNSFFGVCGTFGNMSEITALQSGLNSLKKNYDAVLSLGGESFILYVLDDKGQVMNILAQDKCAAGSGEFLMQQLERLDLPLDEAICMAASSTGPPILLASRCSVHCKSDITHKLNRGEGSLPDILSSLLNNITKKGVGLISQSRINLQRLLVIGGVSLNQVIVQKLKETLPDTEIDIHEFSHVFEAFGMMLHVQDNPVYTIPELFITQTFTTLPPLKDSGHLVSLMEAPQVTHEINPKISYILGIDVGSTTTKAILMDPIQKTIISSFYGRTNGNPIQATKNCINNIIQQVGTADIHIQLVGVTGSGRHIVGAFMGTPAVYNEISAHALGAAYFDPEVDTIFEIGGQDAKYMFLQNGVPVDYVMNASCSAGTGSFLEESAKCDLGIGVYEIGATALDASDPVRFKADCAAFINSDIRTALQEGYSRPNIIGGLVYSIATNYLNKVKGTHPIGKKIFFQGGVAKNNAVGYAFAQVTGRKIIIPPFPELMGAFGIALIAQEKWTAQEISPMSANTTLGSLIIPEMQHLGSFTCKSCSNYCQIERYMVGDRKFPFGGKCTKYESLWKKGKIIQEQEDLVAFRNNLFYETALPSHTLINEKIGIPRALLTHSLYPLFSTFFTELGCEVILSDIDPDMAMLPNAPLCYPMQIMHGAVSDLVKQNISLIFSPYVNKLKTPEKWYDATFCPISQSSPYIIAPIFQDVHFLTPELNFSTGYENSDALVEMAVNTLQIPEEIARNAYATAVDHQNSVEARIQEKGQEILAQLRETNETGILIVGRSYNVFPKEASQSIPKKLVSMGVSVIPFEFLTPQTDAENPWYFANFVTEAVEIVKQRDNLFLLYITNFSCTVDAFVQNHVRNELQSKPYLFLELDAHVADAGTQTRIEAFLEIIKNYRRAQQQEATPFTFPVAKVIELEGETVVVTSSGEHLDIKDPRVKISFIPFSKYHTDLVEKLFASFGYNMKKTGEIPLEYAVEGLKYTSGKECIPLPIAIGHILYLVKHRKPGEIIGYFMLRNGDPCVVFSYYQYIEDFLARNHIRDVFLWSFDKESNFMGFTVKETFNITPKIVVLGDLMNEIESSIEVVGQDGASEKLQEYWEQFLDELSPIQNLNNAMDRLIPQLITLPITKSPKKVPKILVTGDFFVRFSPFFIRELKSHYTANGIIVKSTSLNELFLYGVPFGNMIDKELRDRYVNKIIDEFHGRSRIWNDFSIGFYASRLLLRYIERIERKLRKKFEKTGLLYSQQTDVLDIVKRAEPHINPLIFGEAVLTVGKGMEILQNHDYNALCLIGPQFCMPYKTSQAILKPLFLEHKFPLLVFDAEISAMSHNMKRQITANIEQIKQQTKQIEPILGEAILNESIFQKLKRKVFNRA